MVESIEQVDFVHDVVEHALQLLLVHHLDGHFLTPIVQVERGEHFAERAAPDHSRRFIDLVVALELLSALLLGALADLERLLPLLLALNVEVLISVAAPPHARLDLRAAIR